MAKKNVVEVVCERCERVEYVDPNGYSSLPDLTLQFGSKPSQNQIADAPTTFETDVTVKFEDLCSSCQNTVRNLVAQIGKKINWKRKEKGEPEPVEVEVGS